MFHEGDAVVGRSDPHIMPWYRHHINPEGKVALLGFRNNNVFKGDLYDQHLENWDINSEWELTQKYDTIICTRCAYFAKDVDDFIKRCHASLRPNGKLYVDFGLGDHWRFENYKIGWSKDGEHEYAYNDKNFLWSTVWDDSFVNHPQFKLFEKRTEKFGYSDVKKAIQDEIPSILEFNKMAKYFNISYDMVALWDDMPQLYILIIGAKK